MTMLKTILIVLVLLIPTAIYADKDSTKNLCERNGGDYTKNGCDFDDDDEDKADRFGEDYSKQQKFDKERAADEDALCDDPDANFDVCQSATLAFASSDKDEDELTERDVDVLCDASEDYEAHKEQCDKLYDKVQDATLAFASEDKHERDENDLKDNKNEDPCYYEGFRIDNDHSFCD